MSHFMDKDDLKLRSVSWEVSCVLRWRKSLYRHYQIVCCVFIRVDETFTYVSVSVIRVHAR